MPREVIISVIAPRRDSKYADQVVTGRSRVVCVGD